MGSKHGAEISKLLGLYILKFLKQIIPKHIVGIYRDDGLIAMKKQQACKSRENKKRNAHVCKINRNKTSNQKPII